MSAHPVTLKTKYGVEKFNEVSEEFVQYKKLNNSDEFRDNCKYYYEESYMNLGFFLNDEFMSAKYKMNLEDPLCAEAFECFFKQSDLCSIYNYFSEEWK